MLIDRSGRNVWSPAATWGRDMRGGEEAWDHPGEEGWRRRHGARHGHGWGPRGGGFGPPFGMFGPWFGEPKFMRGPRAKRGDVRAGALGLLAEEPRNGYQIIQEISERSGGVWRPSPGSVYPALQQLEDEGLIRAETGEGGRRVYVITDEGRAHVEARPEEFRAPWDAVAGSVGGDAIELRSLLAEVAMAAVQVGRAGTDAQLARARQLLADTRRGLYRILAADDEEGGDAGGKGEPGPAEGAGRRD